MNILHTIDSLSPACGGTTSCTKELLNGLRACGARAEILTRADRQFSFSPLMISPRLRLTLRQDRADIYHTHGLWRDVNLATCAHARRRHVPCVLSPHGMLYPEALRYRASIKRILLSIIQRHYPGKINCLHVSSEQELYHVRKFFPHARIALIPLPVAEPQPPPVRDNHRHFRVGYLGRLHPIKNLENLIRAWGLLQIPNAELVIYGDGNPAYKDSLRKLAEQSGSQQVVFAGFLSEREKYGALASLDVFCAPSHQENFGMSIAEALLVGTPVLVSYHTPWSILSKIHCGSWQGNSPAELAEGLMAFYRLSQEERRNMGKRGSELIRSRFSTETVSRQMLQLYHYLLGNESKPDFVYE